MSNTGDTPFQIRCGWHEKYTGESLIMRDAPSVTDEHGIVREPLVSHSICEPCIKKFEAEK